MDRMNSEATSAYDATPTHFVSVKGIDFAYRRFGVDHGPPLVLMTHFRASMDNWDPALLDAIARERTVIAFDNRGVAGTGGTTPGTYRAMADDASEFIAALGYDEVDVLGFSIGGAIAQEMLIHQPGLIRKAVLAASMPPGGKGILGSRPEIAAVATKNAVELDDFLILFFEPTSTSQKLGREYLVRRSARTIDVEPSTGAQTMQGQGEARKAWAEMDPDQGRVDLGKVVHPVLVANGKNDVMLGSANSVLLFNALPAAQLILYPDAGHGFLFQYPELFARHLSIFLNC
jgi:pimeloyl-ACP methyl ester carboxylesterase